MLKSPYHLLAGTYAHIHTRREIHLHERIAKKNNNTVKCDDETKWKHVVVAVGTGRKNTTHDYASEPYGDVGEPLASLIIYVRKTLRDWA